MEVDARGGQGIQQGDNNRMWNLFVNLGLPPALSRALVLLIVVALLGGGTWAVASWVLPWLAPTYRTQFLIDTTAEEPESIARSLRQAVQNAGDQDSLALRGFGGECGSPDNTTQLVDFGTGNRQEITQAAGQRRGGRPTLLRGVVEAVADFSGPFTLRATQVNRIILVTRHGTDACDEDTAFVGKEIKDRLAAAGLTIELRLVGYQLPAEQRDRLKRIAGGAGAPEPLFAADQAGLDAALEFVTNTEPVLRYAKEIVDILNPTVERVNTAATATVDGRLDLAETTLAEARESAGQTGLRFDGLRDRARTQQTQDLQRQADTLRAQLDRILAAANGLLATARSAESLDPGLTAFRGLAADYNAKVTSMNKAIAALRATAPAAPR
ncbi:MULTISPECIES: VWA domain-containing protein [unclassified Crossiella]|uniref:VWA domain-containing protein n=1 Tax=unclassified Crossiella TaxID=2620835 RepID=UPI001FFEF8A3|nr:MULTISPECIES: VWA domain-containing protein [unclassified Crossiella]MCK2239141.1 VWA domain-containing protein [Crossiella sp. S99.2]MCK2251290.1 VWA domain-containing protein [Crossiella sp. S99.1]